MSASSPTPFEAWQQRCLADGHALILRTLRSAGMSAQLATQTAWQAQLQQQLLGEQEAAGPATHTPGHTLSGVMLMSDEEVSENIQVARMVSDMASKTEWLLLELRARTAPWNEAAQALGHEDALLLNPGLLVHSLIEALRTCMPLLDRRLEALALLAPPISRLITPLYEQQLQWLEGVGLVSDTVAPRAVAELPILTEVAAGSPRPVDIQSSQVPALLERLCEQAKLDLGMTEFMQELAQSIEASVSAFPDMLRSDQGTVWRLVEQLVALGQLYPQYKPGKLPLEQRLRPLLDRLKRQQTAKDADYARVLAHVEQLQQAALQAAAQGRQPEAHALNAEERRDELEPLIQFQVIDRLRNQTLHPSVRQFLLGPWVLVMARAGADTGLESELSKRWIDAMDGLVQAARNDLERPLSPAALECLLMEARDGLGSIGTSAERISQHELDLMAALGEWPRAKTPRKSHSTPAAVPAAAPAPSAQATPEEMSPTAATPIAATPAPPPSAPTPPAAPLPTGFDDLLSSRWAPHADLETVPQGFGDDPPDSPARLACHTWMDSLQTGQLVRIFIQGRWTSARLDWISDRQRFFSFSRPRATPFFASRRILERMRLEGLVTTIQPGQWLREAAGTLTMGLGPH